MQGLPPKAPRRFDLNELDIANLVFVVSFLLLILALNQWGG